MTDVETCFDAIIFNLHTYYFALFMTSCTPPFITIFCTELFDVCNYQFIMAEIILYFTANAVFWTDHD